MSEVHSIPHQVSTGPGASLAASDSLLSGPIPFNRAVLLPQPDLEGAASGVVVDAPDRFGTTDTRRRVTDTRLLRRRLGWADLTIALLSWGLSSLLVVAGPIYGRLSSAGAAAAATVLALHLTGAYRSRHCARAPDELSRVCAAALVGGGVLAVVLTLLDPLHAGALRSDLWVCAAVAAAALGIERRAFGRWLRFARMTGRHLRDVVLVGANADAVRLHDLLRTEPELGYLVSGVIGDVQHLESLSGLPSGRTVDDLAGLVARTGATGIVVVPSAMSSDDVRAAIAVAAASGVHVQIFSGGFGVARERLASTPLGGEPFFYVKPTRPPEWKLAAKRAMDVVGAVIGLVVCAPVIGLAALAIRLEDGGPAFHRGERVGRGGDPFVVYKLRSMAVGEELPAMTVDALNERTDGPLFKAAKDPRVTRTGRLIRALSLDELPQLWNVLEGTMSLVGPRPALPSEVIKFDEELLRRHLFRPGMTGLWQVEARYNPSFHAYRRLDLRYIDNWSLAMDLWIMFTTVPAVVFGALRAVHGKGH
ncbi:MAG TPA: sugar transferase [Acidimicrobiales bacterium]|nr:sugar transferase [Acidimicrobiales bacterium]